MARVQHVVHGEELAAGLEPAAHGSGVGIPVAGLDGAVQRVLEDPIEGLARGGFGSEKIHRAEGGIQAGDAGAFGGEADGGRREVGAGGVEAVAGPGADVVAGAASRDGTNPRGRSGWFFEEVLEAG